MQKNKFIMTFLLGMFAVIVAYAATWYVSPDGDDSNAGNTWPQAFLTISNGVYNAVGGDVVLLSNGVYLADGAGTDVGGTAAGISMVHIAKGITVRGFSGNPADVIMNGGYSNGVPGEITNRLVYINHPNAILAGVTITNGFAVTNGGGIFLGGGIVSNCVIAGNIASNHGGGVYVASVASTITHSRVQGNISSCRDNSYYNGAAIYLHAGGNIIESEILDNTNNFRGIGGVTLRGRGVIQSCLFTNNGGPYAAGLAVHGLSGQVLIDDCEFSGHVSGQRVVFIYAVAETTPVTFTNCRVVNNDVFGLSLGSREVLVADCLFSNNIGGGVRVNPDPNSSYGHSNIIANSDFVGNSGVQYGGGVLLGGRDNIVSGCWFNGNSAMRGGGVATFYGFVTNNLITHCEFVSNSASQYGGAILLLGQYAPDTIQYCRITHNTAGQEGGGVRVTGYGGGLLRNNLIVSNSANIGGGVFVYDGKVTNESCTIAFNYATNRGGGMELRGTDNMVVNCIAVSNSSGLSDPEIYLANASESNAFWYSCSTGITNPAQGNINFSPQFSAPASGNYRLTGGSPCINAGTNLPWMLAPGTVDMDGRSRVDRFFGQADLGCYEYTSRGIMFGVR